MNVDWRELVRDLLITEYRSSFAHAADRTERSVLLLAWMRGFLPQVCQESETVQSFALRGIAGALDEIEQLESEAAT